MSPKRLAKCKWVQTEPSDAPITGEAMAVAGVSTKPEPTKSVQPKRPAHILWAVLIARIYEVLPLLCPLCGAKCA